MESVEGKSGVTEFAEKKGVVEISIPSRMDFVSIVRMIVTAATDVTDSLHDHRVDDLRWVTSEATTNAIEANLNNSGGQVHIRCELSVGLVRLIVTDEGPGIVELNDITNINQAASNEVEGSIGIPLMKHLSNVWNFTSDSAGTRVEMELHQAV